MNPLPRIVLWISALTLLVFGSAFLFAPLGTLALAAIELEGGLAATEIRAYYGGLQCGLGLAVAWCALRRGRWKDGLALTALIFGAVGLARLFGMVVEGALTLYLVFALVVELAVAGAALWALFGLMGRADSSEAGTRS
ncbi:MAG TPA: DUF4345 domain-containing protein [Xanthomonadaceae bacterium]|nr:DUF4345 domain-containing protein [Xanthomonadaceae bacterium]